MKKKNVILLFGLIIILSGWWITSDHSTAQPYIGVLDVWATWGEDPDHIQAFLDFYSQLSGIPVRVSTKIRSDDLLASLKAGKVPARFSPFADQTG